MAMIYEIPRGSLGSPVMSLDLDSALISARYYDAGGAEITPTAPATVTKSYEISGNDFRPVSPSDTKEWAFSGPCARIRVSLSGTGATTAQFLIWRGDEANNGIPAAVMSGDRAITTQSYNEANSKRGNQFEFTTLLSALALATPQYIGFTTGALPVAVKNREVLGSFVTAVYEVFSGATFTGGTPITVHNNNDVTPKTPLAVVVLNPTVTATGVKFGPTSDLLGSDGVGNRLLTSFGGAAGEKILKPNTKYLIRITNSLAGAIALLSLRINFYEGGLDLPLK